MKSKTKKSTSKTNIWFIIIPLIIGIIILGIILYFIFRKKKCPLGDNKKECSGNGTCKNEKCVCNDTYTGNACEKTTSTCQNDNNCSNGQICSSGNCQCSSGKLNDNNNCGVCGTVCQNGQKCNKDGSCQCSNGILNDDKNCGKCDNSCQSGEKCIEGKCKKPECEKNDDCSDAKTCINKKCQCSSGSFNDDNNCGICGNICTNRQKCVSGKCKCLDGLLNDDNNCGDCDNKCPSNQKCNNGTCQNVSCTVNPNCLNGQKCISGICECPSGNLGDINNCGSCGTICQNGQICKGEKCQCSNGSFNDINNCGKCDNSCTNGQSCDSGICKCSSGALNDDNNCGKCDTKCINGQKCNKDGICQCSSGTLNDNNNCGNCGTICPSGQKCIGGNCGGCNSDGDCLYGQICKDNKCICKNGFLGDNKNCEKCDQSCGGICIKRKDNSYKCCPFGMSEGENCNLTPVPILFPSPTNRENVISTLQYYFDGRITDKKIIDILSPEKDSSCGYNNYNYLIILFTPGCNITSKIVLQHGQEYLNKNCQKIQDYMESWKGFFKDENGNSLYNPQDKVGLMYGTKGSKSYESINFTIQNSYDTSKTASINIYHDNDSNLCVTNATDINSDDPSCPDSKRTNYPNASIFAPPNVYPYYTGLVIIGPPLT